MDTAFSAVDVVQDDASPSGMGIGMRRTVSDIRAVSFGSDAEHVRGSAECKLDVTAYAGGSSFDLHCAK